MASPQKEHGYTALANELLEWIARAPLSGSQFRLMLAVARKTYGHNKTRDQISATQFHQITQLHKQVVARELRELARRRYLVAIGDIKHAKTYQIQKDYTLWDDGKVYTDSLTANGEQVYTETSTDSDQVYTDPLTELYTDPLTTKERKKELTDSHESGAVAPLSGMTIREQYEAKYQQANNKGAVIGELFSALLGKPANYRRLGAMAKELNSGGKLMDLIIDASKRRISDDPHDYLAKMVKRETTGGTRYGRAGQADQNAGKRGRAVL